MANTAERLSPLLMAQKKVALRAQHPDIAEEIAARHSLHPVVGRVLAARGFRNDELLQLYLTPTLKEGLPDPEGLKNLTKAAARIAQGVDTGEKIAICCDFDVDGLSGGSQVYHFLCALGVDVKVFVPDRFADGYGLNSNMVRQIASEGRQLLIAIDFGTTNEQELLLARELGVSTIVIDHHHVGARVPVADVFVNPQQKGCGFADGVLSAAGLAWYLLVALRRAVPSASAIDVKEYLDLACLGTICDMVPLRGVNRVIAKRGLEQLTKSKRPGLRALMKFSGVNKDVSCYHVSFGIGPRINAAGRMVHGEAVIDLLSTADSIRADKLADRLNRLNTERQETELLVKEKAVRELERRGSLPSGIVVWDPDYHTGVVGIVAQRLVEMFYRPAAVMGVDQDGNFKGSVRGIKGLSVVEVLGAVGAHLLKYGGHEGAGGFSLAAEKVHLFAESFDRECRERMRTLDTEPRAEADTELSLAELDADLIEQLKSFAPFGMGNPAPMVLIDGLKVKETRVLKGAHLKVLLTDGVRYLNGLMWRQTSHPRLVPGNTVRVVCRPELSTYSGVTELQANLQAVE